MENYGFVRDIAEEIMEWRLSQAGTRYSKGEVWFDKHGNGKAWVANWNPYKNWKDFGTLVEKMDELGYFPDIGKEVAYYLPKNVVMVQYEHTPIIDGDIKTALCNAALKAVRYDNNRHKRNAKLQRKST